MSITAKYPEGRFRGEEWRPRVYSEELFPLSGKVLNYWSDILGQSIKWDDCCDEKTGELIASLYVFEHLDIYKSKLMLGQLNGRDSFKIDWKARCNVSFDDDYDENLELTIQTAVKFEGIEVPFQDETESFALLRQHVRSGEFIFDPGDGKYHKPIFRPS